MGHKFEGTPLQYIVIINCGGSHIIDAAYLPRVSVIGSLGTFPSSAPSQVTFSNPPSLVISIASRAISSLSFTMQSESTFIGVNRLNAAEKNCL